MNESFMLKLAVFISVLGIIFLFIIAKNIEISNTNIQKINHENIEGKIIVSGIIKEIHSSDKFTTIIINEQSELKAVAFSNINLSVGDYVKITGNYQDDSLIIDEISSN